MNEQEKIEKAINWLTSGGYELSQATQMVMRDGAQKYIDWEAAERANGKPYAAIIGIVLVGVVGFGVYALAKAGKKKSLSGHRKKRK